jgi:hypothetical protein
MLPAQLCQKLWPVESGRVLNNWEDSHAVLTPTKPEMYNHSSFMFCHFNNKNIATISGTSCIIKHRRYAYKTEMNLSEAADHF